MRFKKNQPRNSNAAPHSRRLHTQAHQIVIYCVSKQISGDTFRMCCSRLLSIDCARAPDAIQFETFSSLSWAAGSCALVIQV